MQSIMKSGLESAEAKPFALTASLEDYLEAIYQLTLEDEHGHAHTRDIAKQLNVKMPSVSNALGILRAHGYLNYDNNYPVTLTERGEYEAKRVVRRHQVLSTFLGDVLRMNFDAASATACRMEHVMDDALVERLAILTRELTDPQQSVTLRRRLDEAFGFGEQPPQA